MLGVSLPLVTPKAGRIGLDAGGLVSVAPMTEVEDAPIVSRGPVSGLETVTRTRRSLPGYAMTEFLGLYYQTPRVFDVVKLEIGGRLGWRQALGSEEVSRDVSDPSLSPRTEHETITGGPDSWNGLYPAAYGAVEAALGRDAASLWSRFLLRFEVSHAASFQGDGRDAGGVTFRGGLTFSTR